MQLANWVKSALHHAEMRQSELSRLLSERLRRTLDRTAINKLVKGHRGLLADEMLAISEITGYPLPNATAPVTTSENGDDIHAAWLEELIASALEAKSEPLSTAMAQNLAAALIEAARQPLNSPGLETDQGHSRIVALALTRVFSRQRH